MDVSWDSSTSLPACKSRDNLHILSLKSLQSIHVLYFIQILSPKDLKKLKCIYIPKDIKPKHCHGERNSEFWGRNLGILLGKEVWKVKLVKRGVKSKGEWILIWMMSIMIYRSLFAKVKSSVPGNLFQIILHTQICLQSSLLFIGQLYKVKNPCNIVEASKSAEWKNAFIGENESTSW